MRSNYMIVKLIPRFLLFYLETIIIFVLGHLIESYSKDFIGPPYVIFSLFFFNHIVLPFFSKGETFGMMLFNICLIDVERKGKISNKKILLRLVLKLIYCITPIPAFIHYLIARKDNPWYDKVLKIKMIYAKQKD